MEQKTEGFAPFVLEVGRKAGASASRSHQGSLTFFMPRMGGDTRTATAPSQVPQNKGKEMRVLLISIVSILLISSTAVCAQERSRSNEASVREAKFIALTFDDGPAVAATPALLDVLRRYNAKATFFPLGSSIEAQAAIVRRMANEGHSVGNHALTHRRLTDMSVQAMRAEIETVNALLEKITGERPVVFRPPYAAVNEAVVNATRDNGLSIILWSIYPEGGVFSGAATISDRIVSSARDGDIVFLHDTSRSSVEAAEMAIRKLSQQGFVFVTVPQLMERRGGLVVGHTYERGSAN